MPPLGMHTWDWTLVRRASPSAIKVVTSRPQILTVSCRELQNGMFHTKRRSSRQPMGTAYPATANVTNQKQKLCKLATTMLISSFVESKAHPHQPKCFFASQSASHSPPPPTAHSPHERQPAMKTFASTRDPVQGINYKYVPLFYLEIVGGQKPISWGNESHFCCIKLSNRSTH